MSEEIEGTVKDNYNNGMIKKDIDGFIAGVIQMIPDAMTHLDSLNDYIQPTLCAAFDSDHRKVGYYLNYTLGKKEQEIRERIILPKGFHDGGVGLKTHRGFFRVFKTVEAAMNVLSEQGFDSCKLWFQ